MRYTLIFLFSIIPVAVYGNAILPAFTAPYVVSVLFPVASMAALLIEVFVLYKFAKNLGLPKAIGLVIFINVISTIFGFTVSVFLPSKNYDLYVILAFPVAYAISVYIEYLALISIKKWVVIFHPLKISLIANTSSYVVLSIMAWFFFNSDF